MIGVIFAKDVDNTDEGVEKVQELLRNAEQDAREKFSAFKSHGEHPHIIAWRQAYKRFGSDPHQYRCSAESLVRRVLKGDTIPHINKLVDLYNYVSLAHVLPVGGEDMQAIHGNVHLAFAEGTEQFVRLNGTENEPPTEGEVVYKDDDGILCRRWNWREADRTKLTQATKNVIIVIDALAPSTKMDVEIATTELADLIRQYCGGDVTSFVSTGAKH